MSIIDDILDWIEERIDEVLDFVGQVWDELCMPILEEVFSWFGIVDYLVVTVQKISNPIFSTSVDDAYDAAIVKAILKMPKNDAGFFRNFMSEVNLPRGQMKGYYKYGETGQYINGLPEMTVKGKNVDLVSIKTIVEGEVGGVQVILTADSTFPSPEVWWKHHLQGTNDYYPGLNTLTYPDQNGTDQTDWTLDAITYVDLTDEYDLSISRNVDETKFWITGPTAIREGDTGTYRIQCNRVVPAATEVIVHFAYTGTAVDGTDFTSVASATIDASTQFKDFDIVTLGDVVTGDVDLTITIDSIDNTDLAFDHVTTVGTGSIDTVIKDDEGVTLTIAEISVDESAGTINVPITLEEAAAGSFVVTASTVNATAVAGLDFTYASQVLFFNGTAGETVNLPVTILPDAQNDDNQHFVVALSSCSDPLVDESQTGKVFIRDYTDTGPAPTNILVTETITEPNYLSERYLIVTHRENGAPIDEWFYWLYRLDDGTYPSIQPTAGSISNLDMFPIGILRKDKLFVDQYNLTHYDSTKILMNRLGLDIDDVIANLAENPDINIIESCYLNFAVSPMVYEQYISKILYITFRIIVVDYAISSNTNKYSACLEEGVVNNAMAWTQHSHTAYPGVACPVGEYTHDIFDGADASGACKILRMRHQVDAGNYDEILVYRLNSMCAINYGGHHQMAVSTCDGIDESFTVPMSWYVMEELSMKEQVQAYPYMLRLDMYAIQITEMEWYETELFLDLFTFVMVVATVWTAGLAGGVLAVVQQLAINYLLVELIIFVAEATGSAELAAVVGIVAVIALGNTGALPALDFGSATDLINISTKFADNLTTIYDVQAQELAADIQELNEEATRTLEEIEEVKESTYTRIDGQWLAALQSSASNHYQAVSAQYDFDQLYSYDRLVANYHTQKLQVGVV